jgi:hypothetical protein
VEVHPPEHPIHSFRDFAVHILTIVVGLLIAIGLEQSVEWVHHKHVVAEARENIRTELEHNHEAATKNIAEMDDEEKRLDKALETLHTMRAHPEQHGTIEFHWNYNELSDAAFRTARDTGAFGYMPYDEVQSYTSLYKLQDMLATTLFNSETHETSLLAPIMAQSGDDAFKTMPEEQFQAMLKDTAVAALDLRTLQQYLKSLDSQYVDQLKTQR